MWYEGGLILEPFGGKAHIDISVDLKSECKPTVVADAHHLPFRSDSFSLICADPPYNREYEKKYGCPKVRLKNVLDECMRVLKPKGVIALLHFNCPANPKANPFKRLALIGITCGVNHKIRALSVWQKQSRPVQLDRF